MKRITRFITILSSISIILPIPRALGEEILTLDQAVLRALTNNHRIKAAEYQVKESDADIGVARSGFYPRISFTEAYQRTDNPPQSFFFKLNQRQLDMANTDFNYPGTNSDFETKFLLTQPVYTGGKLSAGLEIAKQEKEISMIQKDKTGEDIAFQVIQAYYQLMVSRKYMDVAEMAVNDAKQHYEIARAKFEEGLGIKSDMLRAQVYLTQMEENHVKAITNLEIAKRNFALVLGESPESSLDIAGELNYSIQTIDLDQSIETGLEYRREIKELNLRKGQIENQRKIARADYLPNIGLVGSYQWNDPDHLFGTEADSWYGGIFFNYPIFDGGARGYKTREMDAGLMKLNEMLEETEKNIRFQITQSIFQLNESEKRLELRRYSGEQAEETLRLVELRYENGLATITDLTDAQTALNQARVNMIQAMAEYNIALNAIDYHTGILVRKFLENRKD